MRIAIVGPASPRELLVGESTTDYIPLGMGGIPVNDLTLALIHDGHEVVVVTGSPELKVPWRRAEGNLEIRAVPYRTRARARAFNLFRDERRLMADEIHSARVDVVHAHWTYEFALAALDTRYPHVVSIHDAPLTILKHMRDPYRLVRAWMAYWVRVRARSMVAVSPYVATRWKREMLDPRSMAVIPNIVPNMHRWRANESNPQTVIDVSNSTPLKNVEILIDAVRELRVDHGELGLVLIGPGLEQSGSFANRQRSRGSLEFVQFMGPVARTEIPRHLSQSTLLCHPSLEESFGICALEAMSVGIPVIGARQAGGMRWLLDGGAGEFCDGEDVNSVRAAIELLLNSPERRQSLVRTASVKLSDEFSTTKIVKRTVLAYEEAITQQTRPKSTTSGQDNE